MYTQKDKKLYTLKETAQLMDVSVETLIEWNNANILKPTITHTGAVVYAEEQISKFLSVQNLFFQRAQSLYPGGVSNTPQSINTVRNINIPLSNVVNIVSEKPDNDQTNNTKNSYFNFFSYGFVLLAILLFTAGLTASVVRQSGERSLIANGNAIIKNNEKISSGQVGEIGLNKQPEGQSGSANDALLSDNGTTSPTFIFETVDDPGQIADQNINVPDSLIKYGLGYENNESFSLLKKTENYSSRTNITNNSQETADVFDDQGNIKGETSNLITENMGTLLTQSSQQMYRSTKINILIAILSLGLLLVLYLLKNDPVFAFNSPRNLPTISPTKNALDNAQKFIWIDQKTDGSVVLIHQGKEHKISKPELNSETDMFIERLMELTNGSSANIEYDVFTDDKLSVNTPLSKLVTRLGFVGLKRDLFFPRTSKNKVLFRRCITTNDLASMGINPNQIDDDLVN